MKKLTYACINFISRQKTKNKQRSRLIQGSSRMNVHIYSLQTVFKFVREKMFMGLKMVAYGAFSVQRRNHSVNSERMFVYLSVCQQFRVCSVSEGKLNFTQQSILLKYYIGK
jgi:hypothetical protein